MYSSLLGVVDLLDLRQTGMLFGIQQHGRHARVLGQREQVVLIVGAVFEGQFIDTGQRFQILYRLAQIGRPGLAGIRTDLADDFEKSQRPFPESTGTLGQPGPPPGSGGSRGYDGRMTLRLRNTLTRTVEPVVPPLDGPVRMYTCGPTVYRYAHIGNLRSYLLADLIRRALLYHGLDVFHVKNITDVGHLRDERFDRGEDRMLVQAGLESKTTA